MVPYMVLGWYVIRHVQAVIGARFDDIAPIASMARLGCPVMLVHSSDDELVPFADAQRLLSAGSAGQVQFLRVDGGRDPSAAIEAHLPVLIDFLQQAVSNMPLLIASVPMDRKP
jgi:fermentation-respiration switch protein FrsA (DUF1100 family)